MKIIYIIYHHWTDEQKAILKKYGFFVEDGYDRVDIEDNEANKFLLTLIDEWGLEKSYGTIYEKKDFNKAELFVFEGVWENGYPQPGDNFDYLSFTYNLNNYCKTCGMGAVQNAPFRLKKEPKWGKKKMFELTWVLDEIFVERNFYEEIFQPLVIENIPVLLHKTGEVISNVVQLKLQTTDVDLQLDSHPFEQCTNCKRIKYSPKVKGFFPRFKTQSENFNLFKCKEFFGSGLEAHNKIFINKNLAERLEKSNMKPVFWPTLPFSSPEAKL